MTPDEAAAEIEQFKRDLEWKMAELRAAQDRTGHPRAFELERRAIAFYAEADGASDGVRLVLAVVDYVYAAIRLAGGKGLLLRAGPAPAAGPIPHPESFRLRSRPGRAPGVTTARR